MPELGIRSYFPFPRLNLTRQSVDESGAWIEAEPDRRFRPVCRACGGPAAKVQQWNARPVRDLDLAGKRVWVNCRYRSVRCDACEGYSVEDLGLFDPACRVTRRMALYVHGICQMLTVKEAADHLGLDWKTCRRIDAEFLEGRYEDPPAAPLRLLAVDEIAVRKGHSYMTVVLDFETGKVVWMGQGRKAGTLKEFFAALAPEQKAGIEAVAMDMWAPFIKAVRECAPGAKIVFDLFHLVQNFNKVIDKVRADECRKASEKDKRVFKGSKYLLLKNDGNLTESQRERLGRLLEINGTLVEVMILKDMLKTLYDHDLPLLASRAVEEWCALADAVGHKAVSDFASLVRKHAFGIVNHCEHKIHTSVLEGVNNKIKVAKRKAYGYRDLRYFTLKVYQLFDSN